MSCNSLSSPQDRIRILEDKLRKFTEFALAQQEWEAMALNDDGPWWDRMPDSIMDKAMEVQTLRNEALGI